MSEETLTPSATIRFGASQYTARGTNATIKKAVADLTGLSATGKTLAELLIEADTHLSGLFTAASMVGFKSDQTRERNPSLPPAGTTTEEYRQSIADKMAGQPEDVTDDVFALIAGAASQKALIDIREANKDNWTDGYRVAAAARWNEIGE